MLGIVIYIGLFVWGMQTDRITVKILAILLAIGVGTGWLGAAVMGGELATTGGMIFVILFETLVKFAIFFAGFGVGRFRARGSKIDDIRDTFS
ncbi:hypothetical protein [Sphingopyxis fribergensis]|jgi:hypothetical protein